MRILYITSGLNQLYPHKFIDKFITDAMGMLPHQTQVYYLNPQVNWQSGLFTLIDQFVPDYIFSIHGVNLSPGVVHRMQHMGTKVGIWFVDDPYDLDESKQRLFSYDFIFTNEMKAVPIYQRYGYDKVYYLALGTDSHYFYPETPPIHYQSDLCIVGSPFPRRIELVNYLITQLPRLHFKVVGPEWQRYGIAPQADLVQHHVEPDDVRKFYNGAKINLNIHRNSNEQFATARNLNVEQIPAHSPNNRTFDIAACKAFQLVDFRPGINLFYNLENELITFNHHEELRMKVVHYLSNVEESMRIANLAYNRTTQQHRYEQRLIQMMQIIEERILHEKKAIITQFSRGILVKDERPGVFLIVQGRKYLIPSEEIFFRLGGRWENVQIWTRDRVDLVPAGVVLEV